MDILIDLSGLSDSVAVMERFGEILQFGTHENGAPVGVGNWDAFEDCLRCPDEGGIYGTGKRIEFPCPITVRGYEAFRNSDPVGFAILKEILDSKSDEYKHDDQDLRMSFAQNASSGKNP
ncbi:MAG TPA: barstar family protein [Verrucomicrobiae bacterium]|nr:barstar family protein [Verrucomicrobiae bacterium]